MSGDANIETFWPAAMGPQCEPKEMEPAGGALTTLGDGVARRDMEDRLRMAASVFDAALEGITVTDPNGIIVEVNSAFMRISGYSREEVIGNSPALLKSGRHDRAFYAGMWSAITERGFWSGEIVNRRKNGELYNELLSITSVRDGTGVLIYYVGVFTDITQLKQQEQRLRHIAYHDLLTGLPNRVLLTDRMQQAIAHSFRSGEFLATAFIDLDGFKPINDKYGHETGDKVLIEIARRLMRSVRVGDTVARIGGDEFVLLLTGKNETKDCESTALRILAAIAQPIAIDGMQLRLSASIGISIYPEDGDDPDQLIRNADQAMYAAKRLGRNQSIFYGQDVRQKTQSQGLLVHDLRQALEHGQIDVHYQPIVDLANGRVLKAEALVRWTHPQRGPVSPAEFIPLAEDAGLIHDIGTHVFLQTLHVTREWNRICASLEDNPLSRRISVNRSPRQFFNHDDLDGWAAHMDEAGVNGGMLGVEITEGLLLDDRPGVLRQLNRIRELGMVLSLDDFGTGYSALSYLKKFNIDYLKIDRSFIRDIAEDENDRAIVESIILMARRLGIKLIAEGVETHAQAEMLAAAGCHLAQGFLFARPMPAPEFLRFVRAAESAPLAVPGQHLAPSRN